MSDKADLNENCPVLKPASLFMLPPNVPEAVLVVVVTSACATAVLHAAFITHFVGILVLVVVAKLNGVAFSPQVLSIFAKIHCIRDTSETCRHASQAHLEAVGGQILGWIVGVAVKEKIVDVREGDYTEAGRPFLYRAAIIGALVTFILIYITLSAAYTEAYSIVKAAASIVELDVKTAGGQSSLQQLPSTLTSKFQTSNRSNPLMSPEEASKELTPMAHMNPLKVPGFKVGETRACCTACRTLKAALIEAGRQYGEEKATILEDCELAKTQMTELRDELVILRDERKIQADRIEYLDVLLEEAGKQLGWGTDIKDILWEAYQKREDATSTETSSVEATSQDEGSQDVEMAASPPP